MLDDYPEAPYEDEWNPGWCLCGHPWDDDERCILGVSCQYQLEADQEKAKREGKPIPKVPAPMVHTKGSYIVPEASPDVPF